MWCYVMNLVRLTVRPHLLEEVLRAIESLEMDAMTLRQVRGLDTFDQERSVSSLGLLRESHSPMNIEVDLFIEDSLIDMLLKHLMEEVHGFRASDGKIYRIHCEPFATEKFNPHHSV